MNRGQELCLPRGLVSGVCVCPCLRDTRKELQSTLSSVICRSRECISAGREKTKRIKMKALRSSKQSRKGLFVNVSCDKSNRGCFTKDGGREASFCPEQGHGEYKKQRSNGRPQSQAWCRGTGAGSFCQGSLPEISFPSVFQGLFSEELRLLKWEMKKCFTMHLYSQTKGGPPMKLVNTP